jgi:hypothetical protein
VGALALLAGRQPVGERAPVIIGRPLEPLLRQLELGGGFDVAQHQLGDLLVVPLESAPARPRRTGGQERPIPLGHLGPIEWIGDVRVHAGGGLEARRQERIRFKRVHASRRPDERRDVGREVADVRPDVEDDVSGGDQPGRDLPRRVEHTAARLLERGHRSAVRADASARCRIASS